MGNERIPLVALVVDAKSPKPIRDRAAELQEAVEAVNAARASLEERRQSLRSESMPIRERTERATDLRMEAADFDEQELAIREGMQELSEDYGDALRSMTEKAFEHLQKLDARIRKGLEDVGYVSAEPTANVVGKIEPGMIHKHPERVAAVLRHRELQSASHDDSFAKANAAGLEAIRRIIAETREAAMTA